MTEQECIEVFKELLDVPCEMLIKYNSVATEEQKKALVKIRIAEAMAIKALEEIQQYRALGTVDELKSMKENGAFAGVELAQLAAMQMRLKEYESIGTVEELTETKELYDSINKAEDDLCLLGMASRAEAREHIKAMARQLKGKV